MMIWTNACRLFLNALPVILLAGNNLAAVPGDAPRPTSDEISKRKEDWRNGCVVYQVIVDRFAPPENLDSKRDLYPAPKRLHSWQETPHKGELLKDQGLWTHELDFWGGDLRGLTSKLDYVTSDIGVDVLYLNPIHKAFTNHKYDAQDYFEVSPEYGTRDDVKQLATELHRRGDRLVLDGVFNHIGRTSPWFKEAMDNPQSKRRDWFYIGPEYKAGYRAWYNVANLPELRLENPAVRARIYGDSDSVVQGWLRDGADGWRLDCAFDIGYSFLADLTNAAHHARNGSLVVGEVWNYPEQWLGSMDGVMNLVARELILKTVKGEISAPQTGRNLERMVNDCTLEPLLKSWIILDNHDTPRLRTALPETWQQRMAQALQFTLPGAPCIYYGAELGMNGGDDPEQRAPMQWDLVTSSNETLSWTKKLVASRRENPALRIGNFRLLDSEKLLAFMRQTDRVEETIVVAANSQPTTPTEMLVLRDSSLMSGAAMQDILTGKECSTFAGTLTLTLPPHAIVVMRPRIEAGPVYNPYKRVQ